MKSFRIRFTLSKRAAINAEEPLLSLHCDDGGEEVILGSKGKETPIREADNLVLLSHGWETEEAAKAAADKYRDALIYALARSRVAGDLGERAPKGYMTDFALARMAESGGRPVLNDQHGVMIYESEPTPLLIGTGTPTLRVNVRKEVFVDAFRFAASQGLRTGPTHQLAFEFFSASFFTVSADARFLLLFMGIEALIVQPQRSTAVQKTIGAIEKLVSEERALSSQEADSLLGSIKWLRVESIRQAGRRLMGSLGDAEYSGRSAEELFLHAYDTRNRLVHGHAPPPMWSDVGHVAAPLEVMLSDLICSSIQCYRS